MMSSKYQTVNLDHILCSTKGQAYTPVQNGSGSPTRRTKTPSVETISGINWYYYLVPNDEHYSLSDSVGQGELNKRFVVCATLPTNEKNPKKPTRLFAAFGSVLDFINYIRHVPKERWYFFEVILGGQIQKLYFDIDIGREMLEKNGSIQTVKGEQCLPLDHTVIEEHIQREMDNFSNRLLTSLIGRIVDTFSARNYKIDLARQILLFSSNSSQKRSYHVIVDGYAVLNCNENMVLANEVLDGFLPEYKQCIDSSMYSTKQQLRLLHSQKPGSGRPKIFVDKWYYGHQLIEYCYPQINAPDEVTKAALQFTMLYQSSCVTHTEKCYLIPILFETTLPGGFGDGRPKLWSETGAFDDIDENLLNEDIITAICERSDARMFEIYKLEKSLGTLILMRRRKPAHCSLCDRVHENENAFLRINRLGKVYFYCRRNDEKNKIVADVSDLLPGAKELEKNQLQSIINQLKGTSPPASPPNIVISAPNIKTVHNQMREIASQTNSIFKTRSPGMIANIPY